jgi:phosphomannomutase
LSKSNNELINRLGVKSLFLHPCQILQAKPLNRKQYSVALIKSISGIRGTIGGNSGNNLTPVDIIKFTAAFASIIVGNTNEDISGKKTKIVIGRDGRISGPMVRDLVVSTLTGMGIDVIDL